MPKFLIGTILLLIVFFEGKAQFSNREFEEKAVVAPVDSGKLFLGVVANTYFKNNEYFDQIVDGYTLFGYQFLPFLSYQPHPNLKVNLGGYFRKDFGNNGFSEIKPVFRIHYNKNRFNLLFGTLQGNVNHKLIDPLYDFERVITNRLENGIQFIWDGRISYLDLWVDWEKMIYKNSPFQERIAGGINYVITPLSLNGFQLKLPFQMTINHRGGQIDTVSAPIFTFINGAFGVDGSLSFNSEKSNTLSASIYYLVHKDLSPVLQSASENGHGILGSLIFSNRVLNITTSYWKGNKFIAQRGGKIYQSVSDRTSTPGLFVKDRSLLFVRVFKDFLVSKNISITARLEPSYDFNENKLEYSYGLYINYKQDFLLLSPKR
jgi:hypothetical protein